MRRKRTPINLAILLSCSLFAQMTGFAAESSEPMTQTGFFSMTDIFGDGESAPDSSEMPAEFSDGQELTSAEASSAEPEQISPSEPVTAGEGTSLGEPAASGEGTSFSEPVSSGESTSFGESSSSDGMPSDEEPSDEMETENGDASLAEPESVLESESGSEDESVSGTELATDEESLAEPVTEAETEIMSCFASASAGASLAAHRSASAESAVLVTVPEGTELSVIALVLENGDPVWYQVIFQLDDYSYEAYVRPDSVVIQSSGIQLFSLEDVDQTDAFPEDYQVLIRQLKEAHPNWAFQPLYVGIEFEEAVSKQREVVNRNLVPLSYPLAWRSMETLGKNSQGKVYNYDWRTDTWFLWEPTNVAASEQAVRYCLDPRNFINETYIFMFEKLQYEAECQSVETVNALLKGTFMYDTSVPGEDFTYAWLLHWIGEKYNVNPVMLASRIRQEQGVYGTSELISGTYPEYENLYNYFNINASGQTREAIVTSGLARARTGSSMILPDGTEYEGSWDTPVKSIIGGAVNIATSYILAGQDSLYLQKFDVDNSDGKLYWHQYMQAIIAPMNESKTVRRSYQDMGLLDMPFVFRIPVFEQMPQQAAEPTDNGNPNNYLESLKVDGEDVFTDYEKETTTFTFRVPYEKETVSLEAVPANDNAYLIAPKELALEVGSNVCPIEIIAETGEIRTYTLTIVRKGENDPFENEDLSYGEFRIEDQYIYIGMGAQEYATVYVPYYQLTVLEDRNTVMIDGVEPETTAEAFLKNVDVKGDIWAALFDDAELKEYTGEEIVGTGVYLVVSDHRTGKIVLYCPIILHGDVNGDSVLDVFDFSIGKSVLLERSELSEDQLIAADLNQDGTFNILDFSIMKAVLLGNYELQQRKTE
ncbi:MAG: hypothetical protein IJ468_03710 [Lachnospiraceae bacterium]|nr:hypothetical protein [Lachnospiraceae bacterium]